MLAAGPALWELGPVCAALRRDLLLLCPVVLTVQEIEAQEVENSGMRRQALDARRAGKLTEESRRKMFAVRPGGVFVVRGGGGGGDGVCVRGAWGGGASRLEGGN